MAHHQAGRLDVAERGYAEVLAADPNHIDALHLLGMLMIQSGRADEGFARIDRALAIEPRFLGAHFNRAVAMLQLGRLEEALASFDKVVVLHPGLVDAHYNRAVTLGELGRPTEALASLDRVLAIAPRDPQAHFSRGVMLKDLGRLDEALASFDRALGIEPAYVEPHVNRGVILRMLARPEEAVAAYDRALALRPHHIEALVSRGAALGDLRRSDEALASYDRALARDPGNSLARANKSLTLLLAGRFEEGLPLYESRRGMTSFAAGPPPASGTPWTGAERLAGRTLFIGWEQGLGDTLQFCRYAIAAADAGARVVLSVQDPLVSLIGRMDPRVSVVGAQEQPPALDFHVHLMSLPLAFATRLDSIPHGGAYLTADPARVSAWSARLGQGARPRIGLVWSGGPAQANDHFRSMAFATIAPLLDLEADWICLQKEVRPADQPGASAHPRLRLLGEALEDFDDTAAVIETCDLVISVCTSVAHLAGAMGKPTWILLAANADWRWLQDRDDTPWYGSARLFRQSALGDWSGVIERVGAALAARSAGR